MENQSGTLQDPSNSTTRRGFANYECLPNFPKKMELVAKDLLQGDWK